MTESGIKSNERDAARLFERGVAAAKGGQKRVAAGLLSRAVQLDPRHELGWLWLSGVLEDPVEIAFCLRSVLSVNPANARARQGLAWLEQRQLIGAGTAELAAPPLDTDEHANERQARYEGEAWWVNWRRSRRDMGRVRLGCWSIPLLLLLLTLGLNLMLREAIARNTVLAHEVAAAPALSVRRAPVAVALIERDLAPTRAAQALAYLSAIDAPRAQLRDAIRTYKDATSQPGGSSVAHAAAARKLRDQIESGYTTIAGLTPPPALAQAHSDYLAGLELELSALDDMQAFYSSFSIQLANRATLLLEDADKRLERARARFDVVRAQAGSQPPAAQTAR
jgi:nucleotide-binding universal stress UspA family protein